MIARLHGGPLANHTQRRAIGGVNIFVTVGGEKHVYRLVKWSDGEAVYEWGGPWPDLIVVPKLRPTFRAWLRRRFRVGF